MNNETDNINMELDLNDLGDVAGGRLVAKGEVKLTTPGKKPHCKGCDKVVEYYKQDRVSGGNTGFYRCNNKKCKEFGVTKYNTDVEWK